MNDIIYRNLLELQPIGEEYCWCCLRGNLPSAPLHRCCKCNLYCHLQCCDPILMEPLEECKEDEFVCFKCQKCHGCGTEVSFYGKWEHICVCGKNVTCCEECHENYREGLFCNECLKTIGSDKIKERCMKCNECGEWVHSECDNEKKNRKRDKREEDRNVNQRNREDSMFDEVLGSHGSEEESMDEEHGCNSQGETSKLSNISNISNISKNESKECIKYYRCPTCRRKQMYSILSKLKELDTRGIFLNQITEEIAPHYFDMIPREDMVCFQLMENRINRKQYSTTQQFRDDFERMCYNAFVYNTIGDEVWKCTSELFDKGEKILNEELNDSNPGELFDKIYQIKSMKQKSLIRPEASTIAKQASLEASKMVQMCETYRNNGKRLDPLSPLPPPYSTLDIPPVIQLILPQYSSIIPMDMCLSCGSTGDQDRMLFCVDCGECYHVYCVNASGTTNPEMRYGWRCPNCKVCEVCGLTICGMNELEKICTCNRCDRSFHKTCLNYVDENNLNLFVCGYCFHCKKCGMQGTPTTWSYHRDYCRSCYSKEDRFRECAICEHPWSAADIDMAFCDGCEQWIHHRCIMSDMIEWLKSDITRNPYHCKRCRQKESNLPIQPSNSENSVSSLISSIQEQRQQLRLKELVQYTTNRHERESQLEPLWRDMVRTIVRVMIMIMIIIHRQIVYYFKHFLQKFNST